MGRPNPVNPAGPVDRVNLASPAAPVVNPGSPVNPGSQVGLTAVAEPGVLEVPAARAAMGPDRSLTRSAGA